MDATENKSTKKNIQKRLSPKERKQRILDEVKKAELKLQRLEEQRKNEIIKILYKCFPDISDLDNVIIEQLFKKMAAEFSAV
jgi:hypothetical protein